MRIALVQDWLTGEPDEVLDALLELFPGAEIFTLVYHPEKYRGRLEGRKVNVSSLQRIPGGKRGFRFFLPFFWGFMRGFDLSEFELIISNSRFCAKWVANPKKALHVSICREILGDGGMVRKLPILDRFVFDGYLRRCDLRSNEGVIHFLALTEEMKEKIQKVYGREAGLVPLPVDAKFHFRMQVYFRKLFGVEVQPENLKI